ncbi:MAG: metallophosphoesterase [Hyphomonadaceae bacterium]|nr:metallophosphoesterase [Hyphomonadaceae bacterium]
MAARPEFDLRQLAGPFDIVSDVHGCCDELEALLGDLGYRVEWSADRSVVVTPPGGRTLVFVGDLVDRGPRIPDVLRIAMAMGEAGTALCVEGNHDNKFGRWLNGANVQPGHGLQMSIDQVEAESREFRERAKAFIAGLPIYLWLDGGSLVVAHAGLREDMIGRDDGKVRSFALYGDTTGKTDEDGYPERRNWAAGYSGAAAIVYGHVAAPAVEWLNNTICLDSGCCYGGRLTALRWPERELVSVAAARDYYTPKKSLSERTRDI